MKTTARRMKLAVSQELSEAETASLMEAMSLPYRRQRILRAFLKDHAANVLASEHKVRGYLNKLTDGLQISSNLALKDGERFAVASVDNVRDVLQRRVSTKILQK